MRGGQVIRRLRRVVALAGLAAMAGLFVCPTVACFGAFGWLPRIQLVPAVAAGSFLVLAGIAVSVALCGRLYCSTVCPLGILQDLFRRQGKEGRSFALCLMLRLRGGLRKGGSRMALTRRGLLLGVGVWGALVDYDWVDLVK